MEEAVTADRVVVMKNGDLILDGSPQEVFIHVDQLKALGLDVPVAAELAQGLRKDGYPLSERIICDSQLGDALCR